VPAAGFRGTHFVRNARGRDGWRHGARFHCVTRREIVANIAKFMMSEARYADSIGMQAPVRRNLRWVAFLLLFLQLGMIAHRMEHYLLPDHVEAGEDSCVAFAPVIDPPATPVVLSEPTRVSYIVRFWTVREAGVVPLDDRLGFRAQAPPSLAL